ncbi:MAG: hypothetical protein AMK75_02910 [Planctomycetes bacterium SM23_65]|nr:MAG: hypothetical protein AMK75_02910 [Planctomycetes bacterium SM23_65]
MDASKTELGRWGEKQAIRHLKRQGYRIIQRNVVSHVGEIDVVARDRDVLVFVEVKTRTGDEYGGPLEAVGRAKRRKLVQLARTYLSQHKIPECPCRFDVIGVTRVEGKKKPRIELVKGAFTLSGR